MKDNFTINFNTPYSRAATEYTLPLGESIVSVAAPTRIITLDNYTPFPRDVYDPYKTYITLAFPRMTWRHICKDDGPSIDSQVDKVKKTFIDIFQENKLNLKFYFTLEYNSCLEFIHLHGVICNKKNNNQLSNFKKLIRKYFNIPSTNRVALKTYPQSPFYEKNENKQLHYHIKGLDYDNLIKPRPNLEYYTVSETPRA